jgi:hypothetical protein
MRQTARRLPVHRPTTPVRNTRKCVHLFAHGKLIADRWTEQNRPNAYYAIGRAIYDVQSVVRVIDPNGSAAFNVQATVRRRALVVTASPRA